MRPQTKHNKIISPHLTSPCKGEGSIRVAVGMSGGVDSAVAAAILKRQGYNVVGFMMKFWSEHPSACGSRGKDPSTFGIRDRDNACCDIDGLQDAKRIAVILNIPFYVIDVREKFKHEIVDYFIEEYKNLRTPNPCVKCNEKIKFGWMLEFAKSVGCKYLATGHYARIIKKSNIKNKNDNSKLKNENNATFHLLRGKDENKDQSYFLYRLNQSQLSKIIFPVGNYTKAEVRAMAKKFKLPVHEKRESQEICFVAENDYRQFLRRHIPAKYFKPGQIVDTNGNVIGEHEGLINYTIGQRKGVEQVSSIKYQVLRKDKQPLYVVGFDAKKNQLIVGKDKDIYKAEMIIEDVHLVNPKSKLQMSKNLEVKIRYRHGAVGCRITKNPSSAEATAGRQDTTRLAWREPRRITSKYPISNIQYPNTLRVVFEEKQRAITPGQSAVFYSGDEVLGGGIIS